MITSTARGIFAWYELCTTDAAAAVKFYERILGWTSRDMKGQYGTYTIVSTPLAAVGGVTLPAEASAAGAKPGWATYIGVDDVDAFVKQVTSMGGSIVRPPEEIPGIGRFAVVADPGGAVFMMMTTLRKEPPPTVPANAPGHVGWRELHAADGAAAWKFYSEIFGWTKGETLDLGPQGVYQSFSTGGDPIGGMMTKVPEAPAACWMFYFNVDAIDTSADRVAKAGGKLIHGPMQVPGGSWIASFVDPQGAIFSLLATRR